ncbi:formylglycine-generating enzyme family protein [Bacillus aquiflavi]|uniref:Formylglycine-generating enzyme family protein n=1 Tax=Bacillus aquiflavi TaxID=2672567 RepID=A0A6B3W3L7_9BACI|nr:formylglycine-generating enzyme family protein [Bacillus aquiflavi]MBA4538131.1 formylglycine-generating enzyme family protein [Bacillus aquiflavi]NEY82451.1 formylglycine-generating enzyme family protein [Bacillus aquiflavi]UAC48577.1 formylglycine-generating enzyme family protein [Bacillus aquiflavi]
MSNQVENQLQNMIVIPGGTFLRGSNESPDEQPIKSVTLKTFAIDQTPVTNKQFSVFVEENGYENRDYWLPKGWEYIKDNNIHYPNYWFDDHFNQDDHPVTGVSWWEAKAFAAFVGKDLPTEAQWEYACKGTDNRKYPWGNEEPTLEYANYAIDCDPEELNRKSTSVFAFPKNKSYFGCLDMAGNLAEWCLDNASLNYKWDKDGINPLFVTSEEDYHIVKGGCGLHNEDFMRCAARDNYPVSVRDNLIGFRCVINHI